MRCKELVMGDALHGHPCLRNATLPSGYCKQHDPALREKKRKARAAKWDAEWDAKERAITERARRQRNIEQQAVLGRELAELVVQYVNEMSNKTAPCFSMRAMLRDQMEEKARALLALGNGKETSGSGRGEKCLG